MMGKEDRAPVPAERGVSKPYLDRADIVIVGNGIAGLTAAVEARRLVPDKRIVIVTDQIHPTINTPALKQFAIAKLTREQLLAYPTGTELRERIHVVTSHVEEIHANSKYIKLSGGRGFGYGKLLIATGSAPTGLPANLPGRDFDGVLTLHRLQDYLDLRRRLPEVSEAVVIGGGVHAIETVMGLLYWGIRTHWLIRGSTFMSNMLDQTASEMVLEGIRRAGAVVYTNTEAAGIVGRVGVVMGVITNHQQMIPCQLVLACVGTQPVMTLAEHCSVPLRRKKGIIVDDYLRTSVPDIYAAGDVAALKNPVTGNFEPRAQWFAAVTQGRIAGAMIADHVDIAHQPFGVQWHATHLGELSMLTVGSPLLEDSKITILTDTSQGSYRRLAIADNRLVGYLSLGRAPQDSLAIKRIIDEQHPVRDITRALLKGDFDARQYLSQLSSRAAQGIFITRRLPETANADRPLQQEPLLPSTGPLPSETQREQPTSMPVAQQRRAEPREAEPLPPNRETDPVLVNDQFLLSEDEVSPFTGNLPTLTPAASQEEEVSPFTGNLPTINHPLEEDEISPFTGNLPAVASRNAQRVVESSLVPASTPERRPKRGLWAYTDETMRKADNTPGTGERGRVKGAPIEHAKPRTGTSLWSYANQGNTRRGEKGS